MRPSESTHTVESTLQGEDVEMSIDQDSLPHLMDVLSIGLYEDPELAALREISTNARDSHIEAGCPERPIEVELPTALRPTLIIRDYGIGLNAESIRNVLSRYGASTKRETDEQVGSLGLGCKSPLAYADQALQAQLDATVELLLAEVALTDAAIERLEAVEVALELARTQPESVRDFIERMIEEELTVEFHYTRKDGEAATRVVSPYELRQHSHGPNLVGWDHEREAVRQFDLRRVETLGPAEVGYHQPEAVA